MKYKDNVYYTLFDFPHEIWGVVYHCSKGHYHIGISKHITREMQQKILQHEYLHIKNNFAQIPYIIGLDMQHSKLEKNIDLMLKEGAENNGLSGNFKGSQKPIRNISKRAGRSYK